MTRIAIVARSESLRRALTSALRRDGAFDVVDAAPNRDQLAHDAEVIIVAEPAPVALGDNAGIARESFDDVERRAVLLTPRERDVLELLAGGLGNKQIAARLGISTSTVKTHIEDLFERLEVASRAEAVAAGVRRGVLML